MNQLLERLQLSAREIEILPSGYHTQVTLILHNGTHSVVKIISKPAFANPAVADELASDIRAYHLLLKRAGVRVPEISRFEILTSSSGSGRDLVLIVPFEGHDAERRLLSGGLTMSEVLDGILSAFHPVLSGHRNCVLVELGLDPKPANFVSHNGNHFSYIDWMPPRYLKNGVALVECEEPKSEAGRELAFFRSYDVRGILLVLQSQLSKLSPAARGQIKARILDYARGLDAAAFEYLGNLPSEVVFRTGRSEALEVINGLGSRQLYELRGIACELVCRGLADEAFMAEVFHLTHFYDDLPDTALFQRAQSLVAEAFKRLPA